MSPITLLILTTVFYAGYNLFIKVSGDHVPAGAVTTISATIVLQLAALLTSSLFAAHLAARGANVLGLPIRAYAWAAAAGACIGAAEITYMYLFGGLGAGGGRLPASAVIPFVVGGTILVTVVVAALIFRETFGWPQIAGSILTVLGIALMFGNIGR